jgi:outer membrane immunogenic protein
MKQLLSVVSALIAFSAISPLAAADLPVIYKGTPPWYDWTGFYGGANGGYGWGNSSTAVTVTAPVAIPAFSTSQAMDGWFGGAQLGYSAQVAHYWVVGLEADIQGTGQSGNVGVPSFTFTPPGFFIRRAPTITTTGELSQNLPWFGTVRARLGVEPADRILVYATGGVAYGEVDSGASLTATSSSGAAATATATATNTQVGWTAGGGIEWAFLDAWSAKVEYLYMDFGTFTDTYAGPGAVTAVAASSHVTDSIVRVGVNYHFGGPLAARY